MSYPEDLREEVDRFLEGLSFPGPASTAGLADAMRYSLLAGGKRVRPVLCLATGRALGLGTPSLLPAAGAIEMVHTYSLIHDDLPAMDDDELRRGKPTAHVEFGEAVAILSGDALFAEAVALIGSGPWPPERVVEAIEVLSRAAGVDGMVGGQYVDVTVESLDQEGIEMLHSLKTGKLIAASVELALAIGAVPEGERRPYREFATQLGILFQIVDDILDVTGSEEATGKPMGSDERHGKITYVSLYGLDRARELASRAHRGAVDSLDGIDAETGSLEAVADYIHDRDR
ncbi:MAG: polyprenyl synthetase family protein [Solirubrobacterales bacterium]